MRLGGDNFDLVTRDELSASEIESLASIFRNLNYLEWARRDRLNSHSIQRKSTDLSTSQEDENNGA